MQEYNFLLKNCALLKLLELSKISIKEIGDGNLNFVYKINDDTNTYALKHAKPYLKMLGTQFKLTQKRVLAEMNSMEYFHSIAPQFIPKIYLKDEKEFFFVMKYLKDYSSMREVSNNSFVYESLGEFLFLVATNNPKNNLYYECEELKEITKNYVFEYPFIKDHEALVIKDDFPQIVFSKEFLANKEVLKKLFLDSKKTLIHGDLHTDSIMIQKDKIAIIDSEFSLFSDISFDIGNLLAHTLFNTIAFKNKEYEKKITLLFSKLKSLPDFQEILQNSIGFCSIEMARRLYVPAKSKDLEAIKEPLNKQKAYELSFEIADFLGANYKNFTDIKSFLQRLKTWL
ncbi:phosphotransferase [Sulfurospirillum arcachonense]|uniref:phosphotransferase n=1 Tax=Sulfurospirillum arcachonense TaxID=57666 RepID=UPI00046A3D49|nr:phosphotransferase [Sulfurospirillum arcachonense]